MESKKPTRNDVLTCLRSYAFRELYYYREHGQSRDVTAANIRWFRSGYAKARPNWDVYDWAMTRLMFGLE